MKKLLLTRAVLLGTFLTGCAGGGYYTSVRVGPPPPPRYGVMGYAPGSGYVWTEGFWDLNGGRWAWRPGVWRRPPRARAVWVPNEWRHENGRYRMSHGHWR